MSGGSRRPSRVAKLVATIITSAEATPELTEAVGEFIAEHDPSHQRRHRVDVEAVPGGGSHPQGERAHQELLVLVDAQRGRLREVRETGRIDFADPDMPVEVQDLD